MRRAAFGSVLGNALVLLAALLPAEASAQAPPATSAQVADAHEEARGLAEQAAKLYDNREFPLALELFEKADSLYPAPSFRVYVARIYANLGKVRKAIAKYDEALQMPRPPNAPPTFADAQKAAAEERAQTEKRLAILRVDVAGALAENVTLTVDGEPVSPQGRQHIELDPGRHQIAASAPGTVGHSQTVELANGARSSVVVTLQPLDTSVPPWRPLAITSGAVAGAGLIVAIASGAVLAEKRSGILQDCPVPAGGTLHQCNTPGRNLINDVTPIDTVNLAGWIVAAAGAAATAVFLPLALRAPKPATTIVAAPLPGGGVGVWGTRSF